ncbi:glycosyltransferase [Pirellulaceae bacterium SH501]|jgi:hypothetical protein
MHKHVTFCIKTIHRPQSCAALVRSIHKHCGENRPLIYVLDDGKPKLRFSTHCPGEAKLVDRIIENEFDIGLSAGRNRLVDAASTPMVVLTDDNHLIGPKTRLAELAKKLESNSLDLLAGLSVQTKKHRVDGAPRLMQSSGGVLHIPRGEYRRNGDVAQCAYVSNCFVAYRDVLQAIRWDEELKVEEHWEFFWRAKIAGVKVGVAMDHMFLHEHVDPPEYQRYRPEFWDRSLQKHNLTKVIWR